MSDEKAWEGLGEDELRQIELLFCPPIFRVQLQDAPVKEPLARCGYMLGKILDRVEQMNVQRSPKARRLVPRNKDIAELLEEQPPFVSRLLKGRVGNQKPDPEVWHKVRMVFRYLMLGTTLKPPGDSQFAQREKLSNRMEDYFFGDQNCVIGPYFSSDATGIPRSWSEGGYQLLWLGMEALKGTSMPQLTVASGGPGYPFSSNGTLTPLACHVLMIDRVSFRHTDGNAQGYALGRDFAVSPLAYLPNRTAFHEIAHIILGHTAEMMGMSDGDERTPRDVREVEAEAVALICCQSLGLPGEEFSRGYLQHWLGTQKIEERSIHRIFKAADQILKAGRPQSAAAEESA